MNSGQNTKYDIFKIHYCENIRNRQKRDLFFELKSYGRWETTLHFPTGFTLDVPK